METIEIGDLVLYQGESLPNYGVVDTIYPPDTFPDQKEVLYGISGGPMWGAATEPKSRIKLLGKVRWL